MTCTYMQELKCLHGFIGSMTIPSHVSFIKLEIWIDYFYFMFAFISLFQIFNKTSNESDFFLASISIIEKHPRSFEKPLNYLIILICQAFNFLVFSKFITLIIHEEISRIFYHLTIYYYYYSQVILRTHFYHSCLLT